MFLNQFHIVILIKPEVNIYLNNLFVCVCVRAHVCLDPFVYVLVWNIPATCCLLISFLFCFVFLSCLCWMEILWIFTFPTFGEKNDIIFFMFGLGVLLWLFNHERSLPVFNLRSQVKFICVPQASSHLGTFRKRVFRLN